MSEQGHMAPNALLATATMLLSGLGKFRFLIQGSPYICYFYNTGSYYIIVIFL